VFVATDTGSDVFFVGVYVLSVHLGEKFLHRELCVVKPHGRRIEIRNDLYQIVKLRL
jgi:hypothetical protein